MSTHRERAQQAAIRLVEVSREGGFTLATAESLTGGMLGQVICSVPGASAVYQGGVISYALSVKAGVLGVDAELLARSGPVDSEVARQMAAGAARVCGAAFGVATTGVAGPEPHGGKPVGSVVLGISSPSGTLALEKTYAGDRQEIREAAAADALEALLEAVVREGRQGVLVG